MRATEAAGAPARATGVELLGPVEGSGYVEAPCLVRRADGQALQLTPTLYAVLEAVDGRRDHAAIAAELERDQGLLVEPEAVTFLVEEKLRPLGLLRNADGSDPAGRKADPLLALRWRFVVSDPAVTDRLARPFARLFTPPVVALVVAAFLGASAWLLLDHGLGSAARQVLYEPGLLLTVFGLTMLSAGFHELGHAAACRYGGGRPGAMGVGLYLVWPAFYTDVTDSYRLPRRDRLRVDLGGLYFNAVFAVGVFVAHAVTGWEALLVVVPLQQLQMLQQLLPLVRLDGYHILADLTGVPDLYAHVKPLLLRLVPGGRRRGGPVALRPWARRVITAWVLVVVPVLAFSLLLLVVAMPRLVATAADSIGRQASELGSAWSDADLASAGLRAIGVLAVALPLLSSSYLLVRIGRRLARRGWEATAGDAPLRVAAVVVAAALALVSAAAWWPRDQYRPIRADERGTLLDAVGASDAGRDALLVSFTADGVTVPLQLAMRPSSDAPGRDLPFSFSLPSAPRDGDNQALAVNRSDGTTLVDVALSLVWATDGVVDSRNAAYALASCRGCTTAAFAFQLVLVVGGAEVVVPQNVAVAINELCRGCITHAVAMQLIVTLARPLDADAMARLDALWRDLEAIAAAARTTSVAATYEALVAVEDEILDVVEPFLAAVADDRVIDDAVTSTTSLSTSTTAVEQWSWPWAPTTGTTSDTTPSVPPASTSSSTTTSSSSSSTTSSSSSTTTTPPSTTATTGAGA